jgi:hypothetical protein
MTTATTLTDLATTINSEHALAYRAALDALQHAILCGEALIEARATIPDGQWMRWVDNHLDMSMAAIQRYTRIATYREQLLSADARPKSINGAISYLRGIGTPAISSGRNGRRPTFDVDEAKRLREQGMTYTDIATVVGVSDVAIWRQLAPGATKKTIAYTNRVRRQRRAEHRAYVERDLAEKVARVGGRPADAYALLRKTAIALDRALVDAETDEMRKTLRDALTFTHRAEDAITRALGIERGLKRR